MPFTVRSFTAAAAVLVVARVARADIEYELVIIEPWNTSYSLASSGVSDINNLNQVTGCATPISGPCSFLWTQQEGKTPIDLAGPINDQGYIAANGVLRAPDGTITDLGLLSSPQDLNESLVVAGAWGAVNCVKHHNSEAAVWTEATGTILMEQDLGVFAADYAIAINELNEVVGARSSTGECGDREAFYFSLDTGEHIDIHNELLDGAIGITLVYDINDAGFVVGEGPAGGTVRPFIWHRDTGFTFLPAAPNSTPIDTHFRAINNDHVAVGGAIVDQLAWHAIVWDEVNGVRDLNDLVERPSDFFIREATKINENGWIIASGFTGSWSPSRGVVLIPIAEPNPPGADKSESALGVMNGPTAGTTPD